MGTYRRREREIEIERGLKIIRWKLLPSDPSTVYSWSLKVAPGCSSGSLDK